MENVQAGDGPESGASRSDEAEQAVRRRRLRPRIQVRSLVALGIGIVVVAVGWRIIWDRKHPAAATARKIQQGDAGAQTRGDPRARGPRPSRPRRGDPRAGGRPGGSGCHGPRRGGHGPGVGDERRRTHRIRIRRGPPRGQRPDSIPAGRTGRGAGRGRAVALDDRDDMVRVPWRDRPVAGVRNLARSGRRPGCRGPALGVARHRSRRNRGGRCTAVRPGGGDGEGAVGAEPRGGRLCAGPLPTRTPSARPGPAPIAEVGSPGDPPEVPGGPGSDPGTPVFR